MITDRAEDTENCNRKASRHHYIRRTVIWRNSELSQNIMSLPGLQFRGEANWKHVSRKHIPSSPRKLELHPKLDKTLHVGLEDMSPICLVMALAMSNSVRGLSSRM